jgi:ABC-type enterochelin transport system permease subunit
MLIKIYIAGVVIFGAWTFILVLSLDDNARILKKPYELVVSWPLAVVGAIIFGIDKLLDMFRKE